MRAVEEPPPLTRKQQERRRRVIQAAMALAADGGYEAVQMRDVAAHAGVALGTIYRYFSSKDHVLAAGMAAWTDELRRQLGHRPPRGSVPADQVVDVLRRACRALEREPALAAALVKALLAGDDGVREETAEVGGHLRAMTEPLLSHLAPQVRNDVVDVIRHVWYSSLLQWASGRLDIAEVGGELEKAVRLVLAPEPVG